MFRFDHTQIRVQREKAGLTQAQLAEILGWSRQRVQAIEAPMNGKTINVKTFERILDALGVDDVTPFFVEKRTNTFVAGGHENDC